MAHGRETGPKLTIAGNGNCICSDSYDKESEDLWEEVHLW